MIPQDSSPRFLLFSVGAQEARVCAYHGGSWERCRISIPKPNFHFLIPTMPLDIRLGLDHWNINLYVVELIRETGKSENNVIGIKGSHPSLWSCPASSEGGWCLLPQLGPSSNEWQKAVE